MVNIRFYLYEHMVANVWLRLRGDCFLVFSKLGLGYPMLSSNKEKKNTFWSRSGFIFLKNANQSLIKVMQRLLHF